MIFQLSQGERSGARAQFTLTARPQREDLGSERQIDQHRGSVEDTGPTG